MSSLSSLDPSAPLGSSALGIWAGLAVLVAYAAVSIAAGWALRWRRDVI
jgi:hypothetical protein